MHPSGFACRHVSRNIELQTSSGWHKHLVLIYCPSIRISDRYPVSGMNVWGEYYRSNCVHRKIVFVGALWSMLIYYYLHVLANSLKSCALSFWGLRSEVWGLGCESQKGLLTHSLTQHTYIYLEHPAILVIKHITSLPHQEVALIHNSAIWWLNGSKIETRYEIK